MCCRYAKKCGNLLMSESVFKKISLYVFCASSCITDGQHVCIGFFRWVCGGYRRQGASCTRCIQHPTTTTTTSKRCNPLPLLYLSLHACLGWWMGSLVWLVSLEQAIRTPGPCELIPSFTGAQPSRILRALELSSLLLTHISALSLFIFPLCTHFHHSVLREVTEAVCDAGRRGRCLYMWMKSVCVHEHMRQMNSVWITRLDRGQRI